MGYIAKRSEGRTDAPLVLTFHGTGGTEDQFHGFAESLFPGAHVVSPRGDVSEMGALRFFRRTGEGVYDMDDLALRSSAMGDFIADERERTGAGRVVGLGYSNGANILASVMFRHPDLFDRVGLLHPLIPWSPEPVPALSGREVLVTAGRRDPICPWPISETLIDWLSAQGATVSTRIHDGGHELRAEEIDALAPFLTTA